MYREEILDFIGKEKPSSFQDTLNHMSYFIIPFPHAVYDGVLEKRDAVGKKTNPYQKFFLNDRINFFLDNMKEKGWEFKNTQKQKLFNCENSIKRYIYNDMIPYLDLDDKKHKKDFFTNKENLLFQLPINQQWSLSIKKDETIQFIMDGIDLWIMDDHIAFLVLKTRLPKDTPLNLSKISGLFNRNMREFRNLDIDFNYSEITSLDNSKGNLLKTFLEEKLSYKEWSLLNIDEKDLNNNKYYTIYNSSFYSKMITAIHINTSNVTDGTEIEPLIEPKLDITELYDINVMEHCAYLLGSTSDIYPQDNFVNDYGYVREQIDQSGISIWKYWSGLALTDSLSFFGIKEKAGSSFVNSARNENYFIYMLNIYISYKIRYFEHELIDKEFTEIEKIKFIKEKMQRLKNEYSSKEIAKRFQPNEINKAIQKGMGYIEVYNEVESNIDSTLSLSESRIAEYLSIFGLVLFFQDEIKKFYQETIGTQPLLVQSMFFIGTVVVIFITWYLFGKYLKQMFNKIGRFFLNIKRRAYK